MSNIVTRSRARSQLDLPVNAPDFPIFKDNSMQNIGESSLENSSHMEPQNINELEMAKLEEVTPDKWLTMFNMLNTTLTSLQVQISELAGLKGKVETYSQAWKESVDKDVSELNDEQDRQDMKIKLLTNIVIHQEEKIEQLEKKITAAYEREIRANLITNGLDEDKEESYEKLSESLKSFFKDNLELEQEIMVNDAIRMGRGATRAVLVKLKRPNDKVLIFENASKLKGKENSKGKKYYIQDDTSDQQEETRRCYRELVQENLMKDETNRLKIKMSKGKIMVNSEILKPKVQPPMYAEILRKTEQELEVLKAIKMVNGPEHLEKGSEYYTHICKVTKEEDVRQAYRKMRIKYADAMHITCAYRLNNPIGPYRQQAIDDQDHGVGRSLLKVMKSKEVTNLCCFLVRYYRGVHLGKRKFEIAESLVERAIQLWFKKQMKVQNKTNRRVSQSSVSSAISANYESQEEEQYSDTETSNV